MPEVEGVGVYLHEQHQRVHREEYLRCPGPVPDKGPADPGGEPYGLEYALDYDSSLAPAEDAIAAREQLVHWQTQVSCGGHSEVTDAELPDVLGEEFPLTDDQREPSLFVVPQHRSDHHDSKRDPEEHEEASEVMVVAPWIEVGYARSVLHSRKHSSLLLCSNLFPRRRRCLYRWWRISWYWGCRATKSVVSLAHSLVRPRKFSGP